MAAAAAPFEKRAGKASDVLGVALATQAQALELPVVQEVPVPQRCGACKLGFVEVAHQHLLSDLDVAEANHIARPLLRCMHACVGRAGVVRFGD
eukprot:CAMPEP_0171143814 /NCGR_PEP_ID=MMETSP0766_2-20121228/144909_1 /TAXON_ID=439317 /ORGANISM="Gambierdiscus australes, Strain CAWD 149" /LENGTH=93 /DNA_ID=CAMNT_0011607647 /DNA_START=412 /DNA_END=690 /DNA_ORIENTATION=+